MPSYGPEVYTSLAVPGGVSQVAGSDWTDLAKAIIAGSTGARAHVTEFNPTNVLLVAPPGDLSLVLDGADITSFRVTGQAKVTRDASYHPSPRLIFYRNGTVVSTGKILVGIEAVWTNFDETLVKGTYFPAGITGLQLKGGSYGPGVNQSNSSFGLEGDMFIRGVKIQIGYKNPITASSLLFSEV